MILAHLSRRLIGELIVYACSVVVVIVVVVVHNFQTFSPQKPLGQSEPNFMRSLLGKGESKFVYCRHLLIGHLTFLTLVQKVKIGHKKIMLLQTNHGFAETLQFISFKNDLYFLHRRR